FLYLYQNNLAGAIPKSLGNLTNLIELDLSDSQFSGSIPVSIGNLNNLEKLFLPNNQFSGTIPQEIGNLSKLVSLELFRNQFSGPLPELLCQSGILQNISVAENMLTGPIPKSLQNCSSLVRARFDGNRFQGNLSEMFGIYPVLDFIDLSNNKFYGKLSSNWAFVNLTLEEVKGNKGLCGNITGLRACESSRLIKKHVKDKSKELVLIIVLPLLGSFTLLGALFGVLKLHDRRKQNSREEDTEVNKGGLFAICAYDGKALYKEIVRSTEEFSETFCIGKGGCGSVYKAQLPSGEVVAVKRLHNIPNVAKDRSFLNEIRALTEIKHRNIVKLFGFCSNAQHSILVYEYLERGSLAKILSIEEEAKELDWQKRLNIIKGVAHALSYMHHDCSPPIVHRDISSNNILLDPECEAHVSDFGTAKFLRRDSSNWSSLAGTYGYVAPGNKVYFFSSSCH
ncbi:unnamed protein product, partial [Coffea canephora]